MTATSEHSALDAALGALSRGWSVVPMHSVVNHRCTCGTQNCASVGKHPRVRWEEYQQRTPAESEVRAWWKHWPHANVGIVTGAVSDLVVLDVDPRAGGDESLARLEARHGAVPDTVEALTGGGGLHLYLRHPGGTVASGPLAPGLDVKADGGIAVAPPSVHRSGARYLWEEGCSPDDRDPAPAPAWLVDPEPRLPTDDRGAGGRVLAPRTTEERREFAELWRALGVRIAPGDRYYLCPLHDDHHPSLHVDAEGCRWYCFGCGRGGGPGRLRRIVARHGTRAQPRHLSPPQPTHTPVVPATWMQWPSLQPGGEQVVVGESCYADALERLAGGRTWGSARSRWFTAHLQREHGNPHDPGAVRIRIGGATVGHLPRDDAPRFHGTLEQFTRLRQPATARARLTGGWERGPRGRGSIGVVLDLDPRVLPRRADAPFLPAEVRCVAKLAPHGRAELEALLTGADANDRSVALLADAAAGPLVVCIDGERVGELSARTSARYLPLVLRVVTAGFPPTCMSTAARRDGHLTMTLWLPGLPLPA